MQLIWEELHPFADAKALGAAKKLGLPDNTKELARLVDRGAFPRLTAALVRLELAGDFEAVRLSS